MKFSCFTSNDLTLTGSIVHKGLHILLTSTAALALAASSVHAQNDALAAADVTLPVCGTMEDVEVDGKMVRSPITENCSNLEQDSRKSGSSGVSGIVIGGVLLAGLAGAGGGGGNNNGSPDPSGNGGGNNNGSQDPPGNGGGNNNEPPVTPPSEPPATPPPPQVTPPSEDDGTPKGIIPDNGNDDIIPVIPETPPPPPSVIPPKNGNDGDGGDGEVTDPKDAFRTPEFYRMDSLRLIGAEYRYVESVTGKGTLVAIYDTGIDTDHEEVHNINTSISHGYGASGIEDDHGHGTNMYGIIGAKENGKGTHGIAPDAKFMILNHNNKDILRNFTDALKRVIAADADVMNNSWAAVTSEEKHLALEPDEMEAFFGSALVEQFRAMSQDDISVSIVFGTGNNGADDPNPMARVPLAFPELADKWIAVTALGLGVERDLAEIEILSNANRCGDAMNWCLAAPGTAILTINNDGGTRYSSGTSTATAHVTGAVLLLKSQHPELTTKVIHDILFNTAFDLGEKGVDVVYGHGALDLRNAQAPQGAMTAELGEIVDQATIPLSESWIIESPITGGILAAALSDQSMLVTDRYDRGYFASLAPRIVFGSDEAALKTNLSAAFTHMDEFNTSLFSTGFGLRMDVFGIGHDVTGIAHADPVMALVAQNSGTGFSMQVPSGKAILSMASMTTPDASAVSLGAALPFGEGHVMTVSVGHAKEDNSILGASVQGAFAGLKSETFYGRVQTDFTLGEKVTLNGSATGGQTSFNGIGLLRNGSADTLAMSLGLTLVDTFKRGDKLSLALAQPLAVSGGEITLRSGTGISPAVQNIRTNRINFTETTIPLAKADRDPELHLGYMHGFDAGWADANFAFGGVARLDGSTTVMAAQAKLVFRF